MSDIGPLDETERRRLKQLARRAVGRVSERIRMVLLSSRGYSIAQIAAIFECDEATVRHWLQRYQAEKESGLQDRPRSGRPRKADPAAQQLIRQTIEQPPAESGHPIGYWTTGTLATHLAQTTAVRLSAATVRRVLHALHYRWRRPRLMLPLDPAAAAIMWRLYDRLVQAPAQAAILCLDECDVHLLPVLRAMWMRRGQQAGVPTPGTNRKRSVFGALEWDSGRWHYRISERKRAGEFIAFLEQLLRVYPARPLLIVLDNASIHKAHTVEAWLSAHPHVQLLYLPAYSGHRHNPVEKVWWRLKDQIAANRLHGSIDALVTALHGFFTTFTPEDALRLAA
ncbi:MAG TPA: IS630 family transposase [Ktedonobacterales bacterium]|jgi:transposase|nr:IS630 family transposase [Ktedonobacterales bacterium]